MRTMLRYFDTTKDACNILWIVNRKWPKCMLQRYILNFCKFKLFCADQKFLTYFCNGGIFLFRNINIFMQSVHFSQKEK